MKTVEELLVDIDQRIEESLKTFDSRGFTSSRKRLTELLNKSKELFILRTSHYRTLFIEEPEVSKLPYLLLQYEFENVNKLLVNKDPTLMNLYDEFPDRFGNYPDAVSALEERLNAVISREKLHFRSPERDLIITKFESAIVNLHKLSKLSQIDSDLTSGAVGLLYDFVKLTNSEVLKYDNERKRKMVKLAIRPRDGEPTMGEVIAYAKSRGGYRNDNS